MSDLAAPEARCTHRVVALAVRRVREDGLPYRAASWHLWRDHRVFVPFATIQNGVEARGKTAADRIGADYLDWAPDGFSGYIAADELYDALFCVRSIVDNGAFKRLCYEVLDHDPTHRDVRKFFRRFRAALTGRGRTLRGIATDGSELDPRRISQVFGAVKHQACRERASRFLLRGTAFDAGPASRSRAAWGRDIWSMPGPSVPILKKRSATGERLNRTRADPDGLEASPTKTAGDGSLECLDGRTRFREAKRVKH